MCIIQLVRMNTTYFYYFEYSPNKTKEDDLISFKVVAKIKEFN